MEIVRYDVTFSNSVGDVFFRHFTSFDAFMKFYASYASDGYSMFVVPVFK